jgi:hypothetical protein
MPFWERFSDEELLGLRFRDLKLDFENPALRKQLKGIQGELDSRDLRLKLHFWFSTEWFTPDRSCGIAVPFYLAHPRLAELDHRQMRGTLTESPRRTRQTLRHEAGHAVHHAFQLHLDAGVRAVFGNSASRYPRFYSPRPYSRRFVRHLSDGYAQSHPDEDFAETFAVWLTPRSSWRKAYAGWPALDKLEFVDSVMRSLAGKTPRVRNHRPLEPTHQLEQTLRDHYRQQRLHYGLETPEIDERLREVFQTPSRSPSMTAHEFLRKIKPTLRKKVAQESGQPLHRVDRVVNTLIHRSKFLKLEAGRFKQPPHRLSRLIALDTLHFLKTGWHRIAV